MQVYEVLEKALGLIEDERNWCKAVREDDAGRVCAVGALERAVFGEVSNFGTAPKGYGSSYGLAADYGLLCHLPEEYASDDGAAVSDFNDAEGHAAVCDLFRKAIRSEKQKAGVALDIPMEPNQELGPVRL